MPIRLGSQLGPKKAVVSALIALGAVGGSVAYAYPPGTDLQVQASVSAADDDGADVTVTVVNADGDCTVSIAVEGADADLVVPPPHGETLTEVVHTTYHGGTHTVTATESGCSVPETATTTYTILDNRIETASDRYFPGESMLVHAYGFTPNAPITFLFKEIGGSDTEKMIDNLTTDGSGNADATFAIDSSYPPGAWTLVVYTGSVSSFKGIEIRANT